MFLDFASRLGSQAAWLKVLCQASSGFRGFRDQVLGAMCGSKKWETVLAPNGLLQWSASVPPEGTGKHEDWRSQMKP